MCIDCLPIYDKHLNAMSDLFFMKTAILNINTVPNIVKTGNAEKGPHTHPTTSISTYNAAMASANVNKIKHKLSQTGSRFFNKYPRYIAMTIPASLLIR